MKIYKGSSKLPIYNGSSLVEVSYVGQSKVPPGSEFKILEQGTGFSSATAQPDPVGAWTGKDGKPMAHWDTVQWSEVPTTGNFFVAVTAFHKHGIDRVEFSLDNGPWVSVSGDFARNPTTLVDGFVVQIPTSGLDFNLASSSSADRSIEIRAVVYPNTAGSPRVLEPLILSETISDRVLYVNSESGSDASGTGTAVNPYATMHKAVAAFSNGNGGDCRGLRIKLQQVSNPLAYPYELTTLYQANPQSGNSWITFEADDGLSRDQVIVCHPVNVNDAPNKLGRISQAAHSRYRGITFYQTKLSNSIASPQYIWCDGCKWDGSFGDGPLLNEQTYTGDLAYAAGDNNCWGRTVFRTIGGDRRAFVTECHAENVMQFPKDCQLCRNCSCNYILEDATEGHKFCVNFTVEHAYDDEDFCYDSLHADMVTLAEYGVPTDLNTWESLENVIIFNYKAERFDGQCLFLARSNSLCNMAFVNVMWTRPDNSSEWYARIGSQPRCSQENQGNSGTDPDLPADGTTCKPWGNDSNGIQLIGIRSSSDNASFGTDHLIFQNCMFSDIVNNRLGTQFDIGNGTTINTGPATNVVVDQCIVWEFYNESGNSSDIAGWSGSNNHVMRFANAAEGQSARGSKFFELTNTTYGDPSFANTSTKLVYADFETNGAPGNTPGWEYQNENDFRPGSGSPLLVNVNNRGVVKDVTGRGWKNAQPIGPLAQ